MHSFVASLFLSRINVMISSLYHIGIFCPNTGKETLLWTNQTILNLPQHFENETKLTKLKLILSLDQNFTKSRALKAGLFVKSTYELNVKAKLENDGDRIPSPSPHPRHTHTHISLMAWDLQCIGALCHILWQDAPNLSSLHPFSLLDFRSWFYHTPIPPHLSPSFSVHHPLVQVLTHSSFFLSLSRGVGFVFGALHRGCLCLCLSPLISHGHLRGGADLTPWLSKACTDLASGGSCVEEHMADGDVYVVSWLAAVLQRWWSKALCILKLCVVKSVAQSSHCKTKVYISFAFQWNAFYFKKMLNILSYRYL